MTKSSSCEQTQLHHFVTHISLNHSLAIILLFINQFYVAICYFSDEVEGFIEMLCID